MNNSAFDVYHQNQSVDAKIVAGLERIAETFRVLLWQQSRETGLSPIQLQLLIFLSFHQPEKRKIGYLAQEFNLTKPTISDAVKVMEQKGLVERVPEPADSRSHSLRLTESGQNMVAKTAGFAQVLGQLISQFDDARKTVLYDSLVELIYQLHRRGLISVQRMCKTCIHYDYNGQIHYCRLLKLSLEADALRLDCPEHQPLP